MVWYVVTHLSILDTPFLASPPSAQCIIEAPPVTSTALQCTLWQTDNIKQKHCYNIIPLPTLPGTIYVECLSCGSVACSLCVSIMHQYLSTGCTTAAALERDLNIRSLIGMLQASLHGSRTVKVCTYCCLKQPTTFLVKCLVTCPPHLRALTVPDNVARTEI